MCGGGLTGKIANLGANLAGLHGINGITQGTMSLLGSATAPLDRSLGKTGTLPAYTPPATANPADVTALQPAIFKGELPAKFANIIPGQSLTQAQADLLLQQMAGRRATASNQRLIGQAGNTILGSTTKLGG